MSMPYGIAVDSSAEQVYWTDRKAGKIQRLSLRCSNGSLEVPSRMNSTMVKAGKWGACWWVGRDGEGGMHSIGGMGGRWARVGEGGGFLFGGVFFWPERFCVFSLNNSLLKGETDLRLRNLFVFSLKGSALGCVDVDNVMNHVMMCTTVYVYRIGLFCTHSSLEM